jgi:hypothetical protein
MRARRADSSRPPSHPASGGLSATWRVRTVSLQQEFIEKTKTSSGHGLQRCEEATNRAKATMCAMLAVATADPCTVAVPAQEPRRPSPAIAGSSTTTVRPPAAS